MPDEERKKPEEIHEKWRGDPLGGVFFGLFLIVVAGVYLFRDSLPTGPWWAWAIAGVGCILLLEAAVRTAKPEYKRPSFGRVVFGVILIVVGGGIAYGFEDLWPLIIIAVGVLLLIYYLRQSV